jgi:hypothetical protein
VLIGGARSRIGLNAQLALEGGDNAVIYPQRTSPIVVHSIQAHHGSREVFREWVELEPAPTVPDGRCIVATRFGEVEQLCQGLLMNLAQPIPLRRDPVVIATRHQSAAIERVGLFEQRPRARRIMPPLRLVGTRQCLFKRVNIQPHLSFQAPGNRAGIQVEEVLNFREGQPQPVDQLAQVIARLRFRRVGPEEEGEMAALLRYLPVQRKIRE